MTESWSEGFDDGGVGVQRMPAGFAGQVNEVLVNKDAGSLGDSPSINNLVHPRSVVVPEDVDGGEKSSGPQFS